MKRLYKYLKRYGYPVLISTPVSVLSAYISFIYTNNRLISAFVGTWSGNFTYYGVILIVDIYKTKKAIKNFGNKYSGITFLKNISDIMIEFGPAEALDSFVIRPFYMYLLPLVVMNYNLGIFVASLLADMTFFIIAILDTKLKSRYLYHTPGN